MVLSLKKLSRPLEYGPMHQFCVTFATVLCQYSSTEEHDNFVKSLFGIVLKMVAKFEKDRVKRSEVQHFQKCSIRFWPNDLQILSEV